MHNPFFFSLLIVVFKEKATRMCISNSQLAPHRLGSSCRKCFLINNKILGDDEFLQRDILIARNEMASDVGWALYICWAPDQGQPYLGLHCVLGGWWWCCRVKELGEGTASCWSDPAFTSIHHLSPWSYREAHASNFTLEVVEMVAALSASPQQTSLQIVNPTPPSSWFDMHSFLVLARTSAFG